MLLENTRKISPEDTSERPAQLGIQSVEIAGTILDVLIRAEGPMKLAELAASLKMPSAKVHRYLVSLIRTGLVKQLKDSSKYDLGPVAFQLGIKGFARFEPLQLAETILTELVEQVGETSALAVWTDKGPTMVRVMEARHDFATSVAPTHHCPMTFSATGLVFSSFDDPGRTEGPIERELEQNRASGRVNAPKERAALAELIRETRSRGFACIADGGGDGFGAVSVPIFDPTGRLLMALTVFGRTRRVDSGPDSALARIVVASGKRLSEAFGFRY
ncbi:DNA-binding IclR family transcriptional regulator [Rhizobium petrolearium]|uniref:IclR family transcriptional regulator n=2 Tax=Neorhizobium TaxID=1525371 RepID=A0ABV0MBK0_9HYPH|nr:IclR family transcriptional regulator [Neorhizobium petrolearium]MBP1848366.1 DNA-binding IclR family transcriptional regulator [Neorhizobium petrolearium]MCC2614595.1 IclR family transcriptional regulator [Neorhizobium petrolearium]WGI72351.1 IclR family transcriptional regulator [Neorhizobium petrolearium]